MTSAAYFDTRHKTMQANNEMAGLKALAYDQQVALVESLLQPGMTVLDVGCGPRLPYDSSKAWVIGLDPSAESLAVNTDVDERLVGSATDIPLPSRSVDLAVAFYAVHHMTTQTAGGSKIRMERALAEMLRVVKPGGELLVFEMRPRGWVWWLEAQAWDFAKAVLEDRLDSYFWPEHAIDWAILAHHPAVQTFACSPFATFPPIFAAPWLKIPRFLYPFDAILYRWRV